MSTDTPRPERVTLSDEERGALARHLYDVEGFHAADSWATETPIARGRYEALAEAVDGSRWLAGVLAAREQAPREEIARLSRWKEEALPVLDGLQELGRALGLPLGERVTGPAALAAVEELQAALDRVRRLHQQETGNLAAGDWCPGCGDSEPCATKRAIRGGAR